MESTWDSYEYYATMLLGLSEQNVQILAENFNVLPEISHRFLDSDKF